MIAQLKKYALAIGGAIIGVLTLIISMKNNKIKDQKLTAVKKKAKIQKATAKTQSKAKDAIIEGQKDAKKARSTGRGHFNK